MSQAKQLSLSFFLLLPSRAESRPSLSLWLAANRPWEMFYTGWTLYKKRQDSTELLHALSDQAALEYISSDLWHCRQAKPGV